MLALKKLISNMDSQIPPSNTTNNLTAEQINEINAQFSFELEKLKEARARLQQKPLMQQPLPLQQPFQQPLQQAPVASQEPRIQYVRRNLTVAEIIVVFALSCGLVIGIQNFWNFATNLPKIEIKWEAR